MQTQTQPPQHQHLMPITERPAEVFVRGEGASFVETGCYCPSGRQIAIEAIIY